MSLPDLYQASAEIDLHAPEYVKADLMYEGGQIMDHNGQMQTWADVMGDEDFKGVLPYASVPVDAVADRIQLSSITGPTDEITAKIADLLNANKFFLRFGQFVLDVMKYGEYFMTVWPEEEMNDTDLGQAALFDLDRPASLLQDTPLNHKAKMTFSDSATTRAFYDDGGELLYVARKWCQLDADGKDIERVNLYYLDFVEKYWWFRDKKIETAEPWYDEGQTTADWPMENPYHEIPFYHYSTAYPHGRPEHKPLYGVQDAINQIFQTHISSIKFLGFPIIYALMDETSAQGTADLEYAPIDENDSSIEDVNRLRNSPGEVWAMRAKSIGQLEPAGSASFLDSLKAYKEIASELVGLPARLFTSTDGHHPGADAVNAADAVLTQRVVDREILLAEPLKHAVSFGLRLAFGIDVPPEDIVVLWKPQKISLDASVITVLQWKISLGIPAEQVLSEIGYSPAEIESFKPSLEEAQRKRDEAFAASQQPKQPTNVPNQDNNQGK